MIITYADVETTSFSPETGEITEIGLFKVDGSRPVDLFSTFVNIKGNIPQDISLKTGITKEMLLGFPSINELREGVALFVGNSPLVAYNAPFDSKFLISYGLVGKCHRFVDLLPWVREKHLSTTDNKLQTILRHYSLSTFHSHRALSDAFALFSLVLRLNWVERIETAVR